MSRVLLHCNAGGAYGLGHLVRALTLGVCAQSRGWDVLIGGDIEESAATLAAGRVAVETIPREEVATWLSRHAARDDLDVIHLDSYWPEASVVEPGGPLVSNMQDGAFGIRPADLAIDANLGAEFRLSNPGLASHHLLGVDAAVVREAVLAERGRWSPPAGRPKVLIVVGGTDPHDMSGRIVAAVNGLDEPLDLTVVARADRIRDIEAVGAEGPHAVTVTGFLKDLPAVAQRQTVVVSAAGTALWDFAAMGIPTAAVAVARNQEDGYRAAVEAGLVVGLGDTQADDLREGVGALATLVTDVAALRALSERGLATVDGLGAWRIVRAWETLVGLASDDRGGYAGQGLHARPASMADEALLLDWRNDPATRAGSRSVEPVQRSEHVAWLDGTLSDPDRRLLVVERAGTPVGTVRFDHLDRSEWEVSVTLAPEQRGKGFAVDVVLAGERALDVDRPVRIRSTVREANVASARTFARAGYLPHLPVDDNGFTVSIKWLTTRPS